VAQDKEFCEVFGFGANKQKQLEKSSGKTKKKPDSPKKKKSDSPKKRRRRHQWLLESDAEDEKENAHEHSDWGVAKITQHPTVVVTQDSTATAVDRRDPKRRRRDTLPKRPARDILGSKQTNVSQLHCSCLGDQSSSSDSESDDNNSNVPPAVAIKRNRSRASSNCETDNNGDGDAGGESETDDSESASDCASGDTVAIMDPEGHCSTFRNVNAIVASKVNAAARHLQEAKPVRSLELLEGIMQQHGEKLTTKGKHEINESILRNRLKQLKHQPEFCR